MNLNGVSAKVGSDLIGKRTFSGSVCVDGAVLGGVLGNGNITVTVDYNKDWSLAISPVRWSEPTDHDCVTATADVVVSEGSELGVELRVPEVGGLKVKSGASSRAAYTLSATICCSSKGTGFYVQSQGGGESFGGNWGDGGNEGNGVESHTGEDSDFDKNHDAEAGGRMSGDSRQIGDIPYKAPTHDKK
jgi:hypothetical protein